jgi:hypothetical protein
VTEPETKEPAAEAAISPVRSAFAVIAGIILYPILLTLFMFMVGALFPSLYPTDPEGPQTTPGLALIVLGELVNGAVAGLIASRIAGRAPIAHAGVLAGVLGLFAMASMDQVAGMPGWFAIGFATGAPLGVLVGGLLGHRTMAKRTAR